MTSQLHWALGPSTRCPPRKGSSLALPQRLLGLCPLPGLLHITCPPCPITGSGLCLCFHQGHLLGLPVSGHLCLLPPVPSHASEIMLCPMGWTCPWPAHCHCPQAPSCSARDLFVYVTGYKLSAPRVDPAWNHVVLGLCSVLKIGKLHMTSGFTASFKNRSIWHKEPVSPHATIGQDWSGCHFKTGSMVLPCVIDPIMPSHHGSCDSRLVYVS